MNLKDEIAYSSKIIFLIIAFHLFHIILRIIRAVIPNNDAKIKISSSVELCLMIVSIITALAEGLVNLVPKLREISGICSMIMCQFIIFYGSYEMYKSMDQTNITFDLSYTVYIFCSILAGMALCRNSILWAIVYLVCCILTIVLYFIKYKNNIMNNCIYTSYIIEYYIVMIFINYSFEYLLRLSFFYWTLQEKEIKEWHNFFHKFPIAIFIALKREILHINKSWAQILGLKESNNEKLIDLRSNKELENELKVKMKEFKNEEKNGESMIDVLNNENDEKNTFYYQTKAGDQEKFYELSRFFIHLEGKKCGVYAIKDQTSSCILSKEELNKKNDKKNCFVSITHDMKNPLGSIITGLKNVIPLSTNNEVTSAMLTSISCAELLLCSVNDILDLSKFENNKLKMSFNEINIREVVKDCLNLMRINYKEKNLQLNGFFAEDLPEIIISDKVRIKGIVLNLLSNALKFTRQGKVDVKVEFREAKRMVKISVSDTGKGIAPENFSKIFQFFGKLDGNEVENPYGNGIGLAFSRNIATLLGGDIKFNSRINVGSKFVCWFLINQNLLEVTPNNLNSDKRLFSEVSLISNIDKQRSSSIHQFVEGTERLLQKNDGLENMVSHNSYKNRVLCSCPRVVIVDDMDHIHIVMKRQLIKLEINFYDCYSGEEVIDYFNNYSLPTCCKGIQIIFLDMHMEPGINGLDTARILKEKMSKKEIPRITIIGLSADLIEHSNMDEIETKPLSQEKLRALIEKYIS